MSVEGRGRESKSPWPTCSSMKVSQPCPRQCQRRRPESNRRRSAREPLCTTTEPSSSQRAAAKGPSQNFFKSGSAFETQTGILIRCQGWRAAPFFGWWWGLAGNTQYLFFLKPEGFWSHHLRHSVSHFRILKRRTITETSFKPYDSIIISKGWNAATYIYIYIYIHPRSDT